MDNNSFSCQFSGFFGQVSIISSFINCGILIWIMREFLLKGDATQFNSKQIYQYSAISFGISIGLSLIPLFDGDFVGIYLPWDCSFDLQGLNGVLYTIFFELIPFTLLLIYAIIVHKQIRIKISQRQQG
ncbi:hypothetical protein PPERSA_04415 [Pseudocohnilembus persalinus]|uniref:G-protein coupled receptors family 1 profile domain-containing protein n=1 Tax=Pseudocohnilembus persalinus TaxID=266149 RepID=A0A0V0QRG4_PSEPJ|nr:hypothetical protein PPERSA_04415 [Pseudocohnilembus persalinus]|eukprot:KRX04600.1 hypothetical protein PPERSA_04415 [Pseudocohnilembus persalinus]